MPLQAVKQAMKNTCNAIQDKPEAVKALFSQYSNVLYGEGASGSGTASLAPLATRTSNATAVTAAEAAASANAAAEPVASNLAAETAKARLAEGSQGGWRQGYCHSNGHCKAVSYRCLPVIQIFKASVSAPTTPLPSASDVMRHNGVPNSKHK